MGFTRRQLVTGMVLVVWLILGPIGMAFSACVVMGAGCEGSCTLTSCLTPPLSATTLFPMGSVSPPFIDLPFKTIIKVPKPPPRSLPTTA